MEKKKKLNVKRWERTFRWKDDRSLILILLWKGCEIGLFLRLISLKVRVLKVVFWYIWMFWIYLNFWYISFYFYELHVLVGGMKVCLNWRCSVFIKSVTEKKVNKREAWIYIFVTLRISKKYLNVCIEFIEHTHSNYFAYKSMNMTTNEILSTPLPCFRWPYSKGPVSSEKCME